MPVKGTVKWFSEEKGYGFVVRNDTKTDCYFSVKDVLGAVLPNNGAKVEFDVKEGKKGPIATNLEIIENITSSNEERIICSQCGKKIIPRIISSRGVPIQTMCPFCGTTIKKLAKGCLSIMIIPILLIIVFISALI